MYEIIVSSVELNSLNAGLAHFMVTLYPHSVIRVA